MRSSRSSRLGLVPRFILFIGFDHPLESFAKTAIPMPAGHMHLACPLKEPLLGSFAPSTPRCHETLTQTDLCMACREHLQGLATLLAFKVSRPLGPCFMPEMSLGFPLAELFAGHQSLGPFRLFASLQFIPEPHLPHPIRGMGTAPVLMLRSLAPWRSAVPYGGKVLASADGLMLSQGLHL